MQPDSISLELHTSVYRGSRAAGWGNKKSHADIAELGRLLVRCGFALVRRDDNPQCPFCSELVLARVLRAGAATAASAGTPQPGARPHLLETHAGSATSPMAAVNDVSSDGVSDAAMRASLLARCGQWCERYIALHDNTTSTPEAKAPRYLEIDCATYSCGGWGNILTVTGQWALVAYLADRAAVVRLPPGYNVSAWVDSPFFQSTAPPERSFPYTFGGAFLQTWVLRKGDDAEQVRRRVTQLAVASLKATFVRPLVVVQADTVSITSALLRNPHVRDKLKRDGFPSHWLPPTMLPDLFNFLLFQPTPRLRAALSPYLSSLAPLPYPAVHVRTGDATLHFQSAAFVHSFSYPAIDWQCVAAFSAGRRFFLAADADATIAEVTSRFGTQAIVTRGVATHLERDVAFYQSSADLAAKTFLDFFLLAHAQPPIVRNSKMTSFSEAAARWGRVARAVSATNATVSGEQLTKQCRGTGVDSYQRPPATPARLAPVRRLTSASARADPISPTLASEYAERGYTSAPS
jgi:hypothetical protein